MPSQLNCPSVMIAIWGHNSPGEGHVKSHVAQRRVKSHGRAQSSSTVSVKHGVLCSMYLLHGISIIHAQQCGTCSRSTGNTRLHRATELIGCSTGTTWSYTKSGLDTEYSVFPDVLARGNHSFFELVVLAPLHALRLLYVEEVLEYDSCEYG